jgi:hypothetical protein
VLPNDEFILPLSGDRKILPSSSVEHPEENVAAADLKIDESKMVELSHAACAK